MNLFKRLRERAKRAAAAVARAGRRAFNRKKVETKPDIQEQVKAKYGTPTQAWPSWKKTEEERLKKKDQEWRLKQQQKSYETFHDNYGMSRMEWEAMFDDIGAGLQDMASYMEGGSPTVVELYKNYTKKFNGGTPGEFKELVNMTKERSPGANQETLVNNIYNNLDLYSKYSKVNSSATLTEFIDYVDFIRSENPDLEDDELRDRILFEMERDYGTLQ